MTPLRIPFRVGRLQPDLIADADKLSQRLDVERREPEQDLQVGPGKVIDVVGGVEQPLNDVGAIGHSSLPRRMHMTPLEPRERNGLKGFGFTLTWDDSTPPKRNKAEAA